MKTKFILLCFLACFLAATGTAVARLPVVSAVGANTITVQGVTYQVPSGIQIVVDGLPSKLSDVQPGMTAIVTKGMDAGTADSIVASTVPPAAPPANQKTHALFQSVAGNIVLAITSDRITYGAVGTRQAHAALITPQTRVYVAGQRADALAITAGMPVDVATTDGVHADAIRGADPKN